MRYLSDIPFEKNNFSVFNAGSSGIAIGPCGPFLFVVYSQAENGEGSCYHVCLAVGGIGGQAFLIVVIGENGRRETGGRKTDGF